MVRLEIAWVWGFFVETGNRLFSVVPEAAPHQNEYGKATPPSLPPAASHIQARGGS